MANNLLSEIPVVYLGLMGSAIAGLGTGLGALPVLFVRRITDNAQGVMLGFGAGVMLAATAFSLIVPGIEAAEAVGQSPTVAASLVAVGILLGGLFLWLANRYFPHEHFFKGREGDGNIANLKRVWLFIAAITIHNFPEGLAVGVGFGGGNVANGTALAVGIGLQNIPEGLVVAISLLGEKYSKRDAILISLLTGLVEPVGGLLGAGAVSVLQAVLPVAMGFAAGAMLFVISDEIIPESHRLGYEKAATAGVMVGFVMMMFLDVALG
ncbi:MAG: ZIP family metal transporter [Oculatellaceae cyanobacterium bins.114]|nr:ZIP family metal transporter [Oculatellaceae cyanobacterium bins.114]